MFTANKDDNRLLNKRIKIDIPGYDPANKNIKIETAILWKDSDKPEQPTQIDKDHCDHLPKEPLFESFCGLSHKSNSTPVYSNL
ncbi:unnamed protein product [Oppiella nova]|uniref:Uncharacterized protein n=1 Tax=Oppiella nova TaxID=334625 RepID=A0A7R9LZ42_9ACAR|nr:unnamed protein product [Oppiella nova]CAG2168405.1 unnamed protein product [Oppiella nova]